MNKAFVLKARVAAYWRYTRTLPLVALEANTRLVGWNEGGQSDVLAVTDKNMLIETEVKISAADLRKDRDKAKHYHFYLDYFTRQDYLMPDVKAWKKYRQLLARRAALVAGELGYLSRQPDYVITADKVNEYNYPVSRFYFAVPGNLQKEATAICSELYPYAGLLIALEVNTNSDWEPTYSQVVIAKHPFAFKKEPLNDDQLMHMQREMSATICRLAHKLAKAESKG